MTVPRYLTVAQAAKELQHCTADKIERLQTLAEFAFHLDEGELYDRDAGRPRTCSCGYTDARAAVNSPSKDTGGGT